MRRSTPSFTVEVRRTSKRATSQKTLAWLSETTPKMSDSGRLSNLAANAPFRAKPAEELGHEVSPPNGAGRILPGLVDEEPVGRILQDILSSKQDTASTLPTATRPQSKPRHGGAGTSVPARNSQPATEADALAADNGAMAQVGDNGAPPDQAVAASLHSRPVAAAPKVRRRKASRKAASVVAEHNQVAPLVDSQTSKAELKAKATSPANLQDGPTPVRKRLIIGRHVVGDEFKPGERWKRLLRWKR